ncbi:hypothetical protein BDF19DRAFT_493837, partial [Syncephalis fuscata]
MLDSIVTLILLLHFIVPVFGTATFRVGNQTFQYHTYDLFEIEVTPYTTRGVLINAVFSENASCEILSSVLDTARSALDGVKSDNITDVIIAIDEKKAFEGGCETITHMISAVSRLDRHLSATNNLLIDTVLYISHKKSEPGFGAYSTVQYKRTGFIFYKNAPPFNIALITYDDYRFVVDASNELSTTVIVTVEEEPGPWNDVFLSTGYRAFIYCTLIVFIIIILYNLVILYHLVKAKRIITKQHIAIYASALCAAILCVIILILRKNSIAYKWIIFFQE